MDLKKLIIDIARWSPFQSKEKDENGKPKRNNRMAYFTTAAIVCGVLAFIFSDSKQIMVALVVIAIALAVLAIREMD